VGRGALTWILAIAGVVIVIVVAAAIGGRDESGETVPATEWAQNVCGTVGVWRGELEAIVEDIRTPNASSTAGGEEPQSETPQGRTGLIRKGLERSVQATDTLVEGIDNAGIPDTERGQETADVVSNWADSTLEEFEQAQDALDEEADTIEDAVTQLTNAARSIATALAGGVQALADVVRLDSEAARALAASSTCQQVREETS
jgi:uncharacterized protein YukE